MNQMLFETFDVLASVPVPRVVCLFTKKQYQGDMTCVGVGGGNMTEGAGDMESVAIYGGATVTLYPHKYRDPGGPAFTASLPDVSEIVYGNNGNFQGIVKALWVEATTTIT